MWYEIDFIKGYILMPIFGRETFMPINKYTLKLCEWTYEQMKKGSI